MPGLYSSWVKSVLGKMTHIICGLQFIADFSFMKVCFARQTFEKVQHMQDTCFTSIQFLHSDSYIKTFTLIKTQLQNPIVQ